MTPTMTSGAKQRCRGLQARRYERGAIVLYVCMALMACVGALLRHENIRLLLSFYDYSTADQLSQTRKNHDLMRDVHHAWLNFAILQGYSAGVEWGRLPCPDRNGDHIAEASCASANTLLGQLPTHTRINTNSWYAGLPLLPDSYRQLAQTALQYAVAPRVTRGDAINGWQTPQTGELLTVQDNSGHVISEQVVAVVAPIVTRGTLDFHVIVGDDYEILSWREHAAYIHLQGRALAASALRSYFQSNKNIATAPSDIEQVKHVGAWPVLSYSGCNCQCAKTRCTCTCAVPSQWVSAAACHANTTGQCKPASSGGFACQAAIGERCVFNGPASLASGWSITRLSPSPVSNSACQVNTIGSVCPLSFTTTACTCEFDWPQALREGALEHLTAGRFGLSSTLGGWQWQVGEALALEKTTKAVSDGTVITRRARAPDFDVSAVLTPVSL